MTVERQIRPYKGINIVIRGKSYPSGAAAARALGVSNSAIYSALDRGGIDKVGFGSKAAQKRLKYDGKEFESIAALAKEIGAVPNAISSKISWCRSKGKPLVYRGKSIEFM